MGEKVQCLFCKSVNVKFIENYTFTENFDIEFQQKNKLNIYSDVFQCKSYGIGKYFCRNCGHASEIMSKNEFHRYKKDEIYFKK